MLPRSTGATSPLWGFTCDFLRFADLDTSRGQEATLNTPEAFEAVAIDGILQPKGMVSFEDRIGVEHAENVRAYLTSRAHQALEAQNAGRVVR